MQTALVTLVVASLLAVSPTPAPSFIVELPTGGWATITPDPLPASVAAGSKVQLQFLVKQHGVTPLTGLKPTVLVNRGEDLPAKFSATAGKAAGWYTATLIFPQAGEWHITIESGFGQSRTTLPIQRVGAAIASQ